MKYLKVLVFLLAFASCNTTQKFYVVRHTEKADNSDNPELSPANTINPAVGGRVKTDNGENHT